MKLFVTRDSDAGQIEVENLPVVDLLFLQYDHKYLSVHTKDEVFVVPGNLFYYENALRVAGYDFRQVDRNIVVHVSKIKLLDTIYAKAYFESEITEKSKSITLSQVYLRRLKAEFKNVQDFVFV